MLKILGSAGLAILILAFAVQLVPYGRAHANPPVTAEPAWDALATRELAVRACFDCHSNQTIWPWYSNVAPVSWLVQRDVDEGRNALNFSEWDRPQEEGDDPVEAVQEGEMPPWIYLLTHPGARFTDGETRSLVQGLRTTIAQAPAIGGKSAGKDDD